jgi:hypothetical protein
VAELLAEEPSRRLTPGCSRSDPLSSCLLICAIIASRTARLNPGPSGRRKHAIPETTWPTAESEDEAMFLFILNTSFEEYWFS